VRFASKAGTGRRPGEGDTGERCGTGTARYNQPEMNEVPQRFHTARLAAEPIGMGRFAELAEMNRDERVMEWLGGAAAEPDETRSWIEEKAAHWRSYGFGVWVLSDVQTGALVGRAGLQHTSVQGVDEVELLYALLPESWGRGLATEAGAAVLGIAFSALILPNVVAYTLPDNVRSRRVMEKLGFACEREFPHEDHTHVLYRVTAALATITAVTIV
jgi:ribosomal-protein-alanine N-acetyltransferase